MTMQSVTGGASCYRCGKPATIQTNVSGGNWSCPSDMRWVCQEHSSLGELILASWHKAEGNPPPSFGDCRKLVVLLDKDGMRWIGIRAYNHADLCWMVSGVREESANVTHWMDLPELPKV